MSKEYFNDILDFKMLKNAIVKTNPDIIFHLAAQPLVRKSYSSPLETFSTNAIGTANVLECCRDLKQRCAVVCITTDKVYENSELGIPFKEDDKLGGYDPYSASKAMAEIVVQSYRRSFFSNDDNIRVASARAGNVIGGADFAEDRIIPDIVNSISSNTIVEIRNPKAIRPWQHVLEPLDGYIKLAEKLYILNDACWQNAWNFGPNEDSFKEVEYLVNKAIEIFGYGKQKDISSKMNLHEAKILKLDSSKANTILEWNPKWSIDKTISKTIEWYKCYIDDGKNKAFKLMKMQIEEYENE